ncbi:MAG: ABC transporter permease [Planctomycetaceae bacterium]|nr:MAG: ABC transporter permease [Planctomycetaceae bacterium]
MRDSLRRGWETVAPPLIVLLLGGMLWHAGVTLGRVKPIILPGPLLVLQALGDHGWRLGRAAWFTGSAAALGFISSLLVGVSLALLFSQVRWLRLGTLPYLVFLQTVPIVALAPLVVHWCGRGWHSVVLISAILGLFPITTNTTTGLLRVDPDWLDLFRLYQANRWTTLWKLRLPAAIPSLCLAARTASGLCVVGSIVGEYFVGYSSRTAGLGYLILITTDQLKMAELFATVLVCTLVALVMFSLVSVVTSWIMQRWYDAEQEHRH